MVGYLYYSDFVDKFSKVDEKMSTKLSPQDVTVYEITNKNVSPNTMILPHQISIIDDSDKKNNVFSLDELFRILWIPLVIIGSYILVHSDKSIVSRVES